MVIICNIVEQESGSKHHEEATISSETIEEKIPESIPNVEPQFTETNEVEPPKAVKAGRLKNQLLSFNHLLIQ